MTAVAGTLGVARSNLAERLGTRIGGGAVKRRKTRRSPRWGAGRSCAAFILPPAESPRVAPPVQATAGEALPNRALAAESLTPAHGRIYRLMKTHDLLLEKHSGQRPGRSHDGKVVRMRSDLRSPVGSTQWRLPGSRFGRLRGHLARNGEVVRGAFGLGAHDRESIACRGHRDQQLRHPRQELEAVEARFGTIRAPHPVEGLSDKARSTPPATPASSLRSSIRFPASRRWRAPKAKAGARPS